MSCVDAYEYRCKTQTNRLSWVPERVGGRRAPDADISSRMSAPRLQTSSYSRAWVTTTSSRKPTSRERRRRAPLGGYKHARRTSRAMELSRRSIDGDARGRRSIRVKPRSRPIRRLFAKFAGSLLVTPGVQPGHGPGARRPPGEVPARCNTFATTSASGMVVRIS